MLRRSLPSPKRYLVRTATSLARLRQAAIPQCSHNLTNLEQLVIVLEDRRFLKHRGLDWRSGAREILKAVTFRRHGGASTIEMQYVRTVTERYERTISRKLQEIVLAFLINYHLDKVTLLRSYLAKAYFGTGLWGADAAAMEMFGKSARGLSIEESAIIASMLVYPRPRVPTPAWQKKVDRRAKYGIRLRDRLKESLEQTSVGQMR
jgi:membrane peptidoglycan carboxypeptidase